MQYDLPSEKAQQKVERDIAAHKAVLASPEGRRFLRSLLDYANAPQATPDATWAERVIALDARRELAMHVSQQCQQHDPDGWLDFEVEGMREARSCRADQDRIDAETKKQKEKDPL